MKDHIYFKRYAFEGVYISERPSANLDLSVVIPAFDEPDIEKTLNSLLNCDLPRCHTEVIVVINHGEEADAKTKKRSLKQAEYFSNWTKSNSSDRLTFHVILVLDIKQKLAGPGYARKAGMDEAARRFAEINNSEGIIASLDADCLVSSNYLTAIYDQWANYPKTNGVSIYYEHATEGDFDGKVYEGIINYELHLRYYVNAQKYCGFPFAFQTVGSSFAVSVMAYIKQGGMNKRKAGEDFYFIHKITPLGNYFDLHSAAVFPSPRPSDRVPFGTGRSISEYLERPDTAYTTYHFQTFVDLKQFFDIVQHLFKAKVPIENQFWKLPETIITFLKLNDFETNLKKINYNTQSPETFRKAFFRWFDAFKLMKFVHYTRDHYYPNQEIKDASTSLLNALNQQKPHLNERQLLDYFRKMDMQD